MPCFRVAYRSARFWQNESAQTNHPDLHHYRTFTCDEEAHFVLSGAFGSVVSVIQPATKKNIAIIKYFML